MADWLTVTTRRFPDTLERGSLMDGRQPDGEMTEFRAWSTERRSVDDDVWPALDRRAVDWRMAAIVGGAVVALVAAWFAWPRVGSPASDVQVPSPAAAPSSSPIDQPAAEVPAAEVPAAEDPAAEDPAGANPALNNGTAVEAPALLTEADLLSVSGPHLEGAILAAAEEAVITHFTTDPEVSPDGPGYVEWARGIALELGEDEALVRVRFSAVVLSETPWRLPVRTVEISLHDDQGTWVVAGLPRLIVEAPLLRWEPEELVEPPDEVRAELEAAGWTVLGGVQHPSGWDVAVADATGAVMLVSADPN